MDSLSEFMANLINTSLKVIKFSYINPIIVSVHTVAFCDEYFFSQTAISLHTPPQPRTVCLFLLCVVGMTLNAWPKPTFGIASIYVPENQR